MQAATATLIASIQSDDRTNVAVVKADWLKDGSYALDPGIARDIASDTLEGIGDVGDLSLFVESVQVNKSLSTDLPEASKSEAGFAAADVTIVLAGSTTGGMPLAKVFGSFDNPLSVLAPRIGAPVTVDLGFRGQAGVEVLRQFTGKIIGCTVDPDNGNVTLTGLDNRERFRTPVSLPVVVKDDFGTRQPNLNAQWMLDYVARKQGFYASPTVRAGSILSATMHGSSWPELGSYRSGTVYVGTNAAVPTIGSVFSAGASGLLGIVGSAAALSTANYLMDASFTTNTGSTVFVEFDLAEFTAATTGFFLGLSPSSTAGPHLDWAVDFKVDVTAHTLTVQTYRNGALGTAVVTMATLTAGAEHYLGVQVTFTATGFVVQAKCDGTTGTATGVVGNPTGSPAFDVAGMYISVGHRFSGLQITTEAYVSTMFNDGFVATAAFEESFNELTGTATTDTSDPWEICQRIASAEQGIFGFDENGVLRFYNREHLTGGAAVATITTDPSVAFANLIQAASDERVEGVANYVTVSAVPMAPDPASTSIWSLAELIGIPALSSIVITAEFPGAVYGFSAFTYRASLTADGLGGDVTTFDLGATRVTATTYKLLLINTGGAPIFLVGNSTTPGLEGQPMLGLVGQCLRPALESGYTAIAQDLGSQLVYGVQTLDIPANEWMQSTASADAEADHLCGALANPSPVLTGVEIVSDPRLQLGDRVRVKDPTGLYLDGDFWLVGSTPRHSASDTGQTVTLRQA